MAKLDALKEKLGAMRSSFLEKLDKIAFFKKWREKRTSSGATPAPSAQTYSIGRIYRQGGVKTRLQVIFVYIFALLAVYFTVKAGQKIIHRMASSTEHEKLVEDYSKGLADMNQKAVEKASLLSLGKFIANAYVDGKTGQMMSVDIWVRVSDPETAEFVERSDALIRDWVVDALNSAFVNGVSLLSESGKEKAKGMIREKVNKSIPSGAIEEVFFENLILQ